MKSKATSKFWKCYHALPTKIQQRAKFIYILFQNDCLHPSLHYKKVHSTLPIYSVRITKNYRAVGIEKKDNIIWFWIGSHKQYENLLKQI